MPGYKNWFKINLKLGSKNKELPFAMELCVPPKLNTDFKQASDEAAEIIASKFNKLHLCLSGGMDSEYVATVLMRNKIPFTPVILKTIDNTAESWYAQHFCKRNNLEPLILDYTSNHRDLLSIMFRYSVQAKLINSISFFPHAIADHIKDLGGSLITGYGDPFPVSNDYNVVVDDQLEMEEHDFYLDVSFGERHPGGFFSYTPDIFFAMITNLPRGVNLQVAKEILYKVPVRSKITGPLTLPEFIPDKARSPKELNLRCVRMSRSDLLNRIKTETTIKLSCR